MKKIEFEYNEICYLYRLLIKKEEDMKIAEDEFDRENPYDRNLINLLKEKIVGKNTLDYLENQKLLIAMYEKESD